MPWHLVAEQDAVSTVHQYGTHEVIALLTKLHNLIKLSTICIAVSQGKGKLIDLLSAEPEISKIFDRKALEDLLDTTKYLGNSGGIIDHVLSLVK